MDEFLLAENPMNDDNCVAVIHTREPIAIIECMEGQLQLEDDTYFKQYSFLNDDGIKENWTLCVHHLTTSDTLQLDEVSPVANKMLDDAWSWYEAYMRWQDKEDESMYGSNF